MIMFCQKSVSLGDFFKWKTVQLPPLVIWFWQCFCLFPDWYIDEPFSACNERLGHLGVKLARGFVGVSIEQKIHRRYENLFTQ